jgi:hypothetical protein
VTAGPIPRLRKAVATTAFFSISRRADGTDKRPSLENVSIMSCVGKMLFCADKRSKLRRELFARQDEVEAQRNDLIGQLEAQLEQRVEEKTLFAIE